MLHFQKRCVFFKFLVVNKTSYFSKRALSADTVCNKWLKEPWGYHYYVGLDFDIIIRWKICTEAKDQSNVITNSFKKLQKF